MTTGTPLPRQREPALAGQTVVVIGGSAGIGLETARRARAQGANVVLTARNPERLQRGAAMGTTPCRTSVRRDARLEKRCGQRAARAYCVPGSRSRTLRRPS